MLNGHPAAYVAQLSFETSEVFTVASYHGIFNQLSLHRAHADMQQLLVWLIIQLFFKKSVSYIWESLYLSYPDAE